MQEIGDKETKRKISRLRLASFRCIPIKVLNSLHLASFRCIPIKVLNSGLSLLVAAFIKAKAGYSGLSLLVAEQKICQSSGNFTHNKHRR